MKKVIKSLTAKVVFIFSMFAIAALPAWANATSDGNNSINSTSMSPVSIVGFVVLTIALVILLAAKSPRRISH